MKTLNVEQYSAKKKADWNTFVKQSKNGTFLFERDFMEYHQDRFQDYSLMVYEEEKLLAVIPANRVEDEVYSHQGLTYGGIVFRDFEKVRVVESIFKELLYFLKEEAFKSLTLKLLPSKYNCFQSSAIDYFLFQYKAKLVRRDMNFFIPLQHNLKQHKNKHKIYNKEYVSNLQVNEEQGFTSFWKLILQPVLKQKYETNPVHSLAEIELLAKRFPENIKQFNVYHNETLVAGMTLFIEVEQKVVKSQYGTVNEEGKKLKALDFLYLELFKKYKELGFNYFDLGVTNEGNGYSFNKGLTNYKEELGGIPVNLDSYKIML